MVECMGRRSRTLPFLISTVSTLTLRADTAGANETVRIINRARNFISHLSLTAPHRGARSAFFAGIYVARRWLEQPTRPSLPSNFLSALDRGFETTTEKRC